MVKCYQYTADGYYAGEAEDYGLLPNNATRTSPPDVPNGYVARWTGEEWTLVEDHKGKSGYLDGQPHTITEYGPLPEGWGDEPPESTPEEVKAKRRAEIQRELDAIDMQSVRPLRAKLAGTATAEDEARLASLEAQAQALRAELAGLQQ